jgi:hypothetical protein
MATAATDKESTAARAYLDRVNVVRVRAVSLLNISESPFLQVKKNLRPNISSTAPAENFQRAPIN